MFAHACVLLLTTQLNTKGEILVLPKRQKLPLTSVQGYRLALQVTLSTLVYSVCSKAFFLYFCVTVWYCWTNAEFIAGSMMFPHPFLSKKALRRNPKRDAIDNILLMEILHHSEGRFLPLTKINTSFQMHVSHDWTPTTGLSVCLCEQLWSRMTPEEFSFMSSPHIHCLRDSPWRGIAVTVGSRKKILKTEMPVNKAYTIWILMFWSLTSLAEDTKEEKLFHQRRSSEIKMLTGKCF